MTTYMSLATDEIDGLKYGANTPAAKDAFASSKKYLWNTGAIISSFTVSLV